MSEDVVTSPGTEFGVVLVQMEPESPTTSELVNQQQSTRILGKNPLEITVTLKRILEYVGSDHKSLLNCRLVDSAWNKLSVEVLNQKKSTVAVGCDVYPSGVVKEDFGLYVRSKFGTNVFTHSSQFQYYCENRDKTDKECTASVFDYLSLKLHVNFFYSECTPQILRGLYTLPVVNVRSLTLTHEKIPVFNDSDNDRPLVQVVELLRLCASTVEELTYIVRNRCDYWEPSVRGKPFQVQWIPIIFPKLQAMFITLENGSDLNGFVVQIANSAPKLRQLSFTQEDFGLRPETALTSSWQQQKNLIRLKDELCPATREQIQELTLAIPEWIWIRPGVLNQWVFPHMQKLVMHVNSLNLMTGSVNSFLWECFPVLSSLDFVLMDDIAILGLPTPDEVLQMQIFHNLRNLEHFGFTLLASTRLDVDTGPNGVVLRSKFVNLLLRDVAVHSTNIRSMELDLGTVHQLYTRRIMIEHQGDAPMYEDVEFRTVVKLILRGDMHEVDEADGQPETMIQAMFPSLTDITLHLERDIYLEVAPPFVMRNYFSGILRIPRIRHLVLKMFYKRWIPAEDLDASVIAPSLEHLELYQPDGEHWYNTLEAFQVADLRAILAKFPNLKMLGVDMRIFRDEGAHNGTSQTEVIDQLGQLKEEFPDVDVQFT